MYFHALVILIKDKLDIEEFSVFVKVGINTRYHSVYYIFSPINIFVKYMVNSYFNPLFELLNTN